MADVVDPYAQFDDPYAQFDQPGVVEDSAKVAGPSLLRGAIGTLTMPGTLSSLLGKGAQWAIEKVAPDSQAAGAIKSLNEMDTDPKTGKSIGEEHSFFPTNETVVKKAEEKTGPLYEAKTPVGKAVQTGFEVAPALATGGGSIPGIIAKSAGSGAASELLGEGAAKLKGYLPDAAQPWAEPVGRAVGAIGGSFAPAGVRRVVTPLPMEADQAATVAALKAKQPNFPMTAGQMTDSPAVRGLEGRTSKFSDMPAKQEEAFTRGTMQEMGQDGLATPENIAKGSGVGDKIGAIRRGNEINPAEFPQLNKDINTIVKKYSGVVGKDNATLLSDLQKEIRLGASNNPNVASMPGARYDYMRQRLQGAIDNAGTGTENKALSDVRSKLDEAFHRSIPADQSTELKKLETQYANYNIIKNKAPTGKDTVTPKEVSSAVAKGFGNAAVNENRGTLAPWAANASKVMQEIPKPEPEGVSALSKILGMGAGYLGGAVPAALGGTGLTHAMTEAGPLGAIAGREAIGPTIDFLKNTAGRAINSAPGQKYLKNQLWEPGAATTAERAMIARLLMSPPETQLLPNQSK